MRTRTMFWLVLLTMTATAATLAGQPLGDSSLTAKAAKAPATAVVPEASIPAPEIPLPPTLWDNGDTDGSNGYSHAPAAAFGYRRSVLDDFVVPPGVNWSAQGLSWLLIWDGGGTGLGTGAEIIFHADSAGSPGAVVATAVVTGWSEVATGRSWFGRAEDRVTALFDTVTLGPGTYWVEFLPIGPQNSYCMIRQSITGSQCWVNYADYGGLQPGSSMFEVGADLSWMLLGTSGTAFDGTFMDDLGRTQFCVSKKTGSYQWSILSGPGAGLVFTGTAQVLNNGAKFINFPGAATVLNFSWDPLRKKASGYLIGAPAPPVRAELATSIYSQLNDKNTADDPPGCSQRPPAVPNME